MLISASFHSTEQLKSNLGMNSMKKPISLTVAQVLLALLCVASLGKIAIILGPHPSELKTYWSTGGFYAVLSWNLILICLCILTFKGIRQKQSWSRIVSGSLFLLIGLISRIINDTSHTIIKSEPEVLATALLFWGLIILAFTLLFSKKVKHYFTEGSI